MWPRQSPFSTDTTKKLTNQKIAKIYLHKETFTLTQIFFIKVSSLRWTPPPSPICYLHGSACLFTSSGGPWQQLCEVRRCFEQIEGVFELFFVNLPAARDDCLFNVNFLNILTPNFFFYFFFLRCLPLWDPL